MSNIYYWEKLTFSKLAGKVNFSKRKFKEMHQLWRAKRYTVNSGNVYFGIIVFSCFSSSKSCLRFPSIIFAWEINGFCHITWQNEVDFRDIMNLSPNSLVKNFCLENKRLENVFLTLTVNYCKIAQKNKLCHSKQQWLLV